MDNQATSSVKEAEEEKSKFPSSSEIEPAAASPDKTENQTNTHSSVTVLSILAESSDDDDESPAAAAARSKSKRGCCCAVRPTTLCKWILHMFSQLLKIWYACLTPAIFAIALGVITSCLVITITATLPLLLLSFLVIRLLQFFTHGDPYNKAIQLKQFIRTIILLDMVVLMIVFWVFYSVPKYALAGHVTLAGLTLSHWVGIYNVLVGIYLFSYFVSVTSTNILSAVSMVHTDSGLNASESMIEIIDCLIFWLAESQVIMKRVPDFKTHKILGLHTQKWIEVLIFVLIAYNVITLSTNMIVWLMKKLVSHTFVEKKDESKEYSDDECLMIKEKFLRRRFLVYWATGLRRSVNYILSSVLLLATWVSYFGSHVEKTPKAKKILEFGTWTSLSLLICSFLWLIKTCVLLSWEARSVYTRLNSKILKGSKQLYLLGIIGSPNHDILNLKCVHEEQLLVCNIPFLLTSLHLQDEDESKKKKKSVEHDLIMKENPAPTLYCLQQAAGYFLRAKNTLLKESYTSEIFAKLMSPDEHGERDIEKNLKELIQAGCDKKKDWKYFKDDLRECVGSSVVSSKNIRTWMERAHKNCLFLANTLSSAKEVVDCLNKIISWLMMVATFIMWLLLTGLATTKILVLIASPLLAATFIFGDTCKTLFQGIIFAYMVHPFDVGDLCVIDEIMTEVKTIGVWKTTFSKVGTQEDVIYPNSELSNKNIINYKTDFNWNCYVELDVTSLGKENIKTVKREIEKHLSGDKDKFSPDSGCVEVLATGDNIKIAINFRHNNVMRNNRTYYECLKEKRELRSDFVLHAQSLVDQMKNEGTKTPGLHSTL